MKWALISIWLTASGNIHPDPWEFYPSQDACQEAKSKSRSNFDREKSEEGFLLLSGCLYRPDLKNFTGIDMLLSPEGKIK